MANSIVKLNSYDGSNVATKNLHWVQPETSQEQRRCQFMLSKDNDLVGFYPGQMPILIDDRWEKKFGAELREMWSTKGYLKFVSNEEFLLAVCSGIFALSKLNTNVEEKAQICFHVRTTFESFANKCCPDCGEFVSPNLVIGYLATAIQEINEMTWEHKGEKSEKGEKGKEE